MPNMQNTYPGRIHNPAAVLEHAGRFDGGKALIVLGGPSGVDWEQLRDEIKPDVILTANGKTDLPGTSYWMLSEDIRPGYKLAQAGDELQQRFLKILVGKNTAETLLVFWRNWRTLEQIGFDMQRCLAIGRVSYDVDEIPADFSLREYRNGYLGGGRSKRPEAWRHVPGHVSNVGLHLLHHAGLLGCAEVHTIGFDLVVKDGVHHWYEYPPYRADRLRNEKMFTKYKGAATQVLWLEIAEYLKGIEYLFDNAGMVWKDHSDGLLKLKGLRCAIEIDEKISKEA